MRSDNTPVRSEENELLPIKLRVSSAKPEALAARVRQLTEHSASLRGALHAIHPQLF